MRHIYILILFQIFSLTALAKGTFSNHVDEAPGGYDFVLYEPDAECCPQPLIVALHSRSASGHDLEKVDMFGTIDALHSGMELDAVVIAPQADNDRWDPRKIKNNINWAITNLNIDPNRIYAIGMSMGGNGTAALAEAYPDSIAAAVILAGGLDKGMPANLNKVPVWLIRGDEDRPEAIERTERMVNHMRDQADGAPRLIYTKVKGLDHRQHERALYMPYFYNWLLSHNLNDPGRPASTASELTIKHLKNSYKGLKLREGSAAKRKSRRPGRPPMAHGPRRW